MDGPNGHISSLYYTTGTDWSTLTRIYLPQVQLNSHTVINPLSFATTLTQTFQNPNSRPISQARYTFPLYDGVAVTGYVISYAGKVLRGTVKQKDVARQSYQAAVDRGETAGLLESLPAGVFGVTIGNVPARTDVVVEINYCGELKHDAAIDGLRYTLPTSIAPRYGLQPGTALQANTVANTGITITVDVDMAGSAIRKMQSPSHPISVTMGETSSATHGPQAAFVPSQASASLTLGTTELAGDFILQLLIDDIGKPRAIIETHPTLPNQRAIMATLVPRFNLAPIYPEIVFIADQSGSMEGAKNVALVAALRVFLKSLPLGVRFNICAFGNTFKFLWPKSQAYNEQHLKSALAFVNGFSASYGGTEILRPITAAFKQRLSDLPLEVMLLTDGEIWAEDNVFQYINEQIQHDKTDARVFALGIGDDVSHTLVEGVARAGNGFAQFVTQNEDADLKVVRMLKGALYAHTKDYEIEVHYGHEHGESKMQDDDDGFEIVDKVRECLNLNEAWAGSETSVDTKTTLVQPQSFFDESVDLEPETTKHNGETASRYSHLPDITTPRLLQGPSEIPPLSPFNRTTLYLILEPGTPERTVSSVTLRAQGPDGPLALNIPVDASPFTTTAAPVHKLAARKIMQDLEEGRGWLQHATVAGQPVKDKYPSRFDEIVEREAVQLGEKFQVAGKWTSFVALVQNDDTAPTEPELDHIDEAIAFTPLAPAPRAYARATVSACLAVPGSACGGPRRRKMAFTGFMPSLPAIPNPFRRDRLMARDQSGGATFGITPGGAQPAMAKFRAGRGVPPPPACRKTPQPAVPTTTANFLSSPQSDSNDDTEEAPLTLVDSMRKLIDLQNFFGAWDWSSALFLAIRVTESVVDRNAIISNGDQQTCATALAVAFLELRLAENKEVWEMIAQKGRTWLVSTVGADAVDGVIERAGRFV